MGDFDGDGQADILWRGRAGEAVVWTMDGAQVAGAAALPNPTAYWAVA